MILGTVGRGHQREINPVYVVVDPRMVDIFPLLQIACYLSLGLLACIYHSCTKIELICYPFRLKTPTVCFYFKSATKDKFLERTDEISFFK